MSDWLFDLDCVDVYPIKNGWQAGDMRRRIAAAGPTPDEAVWELRRVCAIFDHSLATYYAERGSQECTRKAPEGASQTQPFPAGVVQASYRARPEPVKPEGETQ